MLKRVPAIYRKEMLDMVRDRRTLFSMILVPILVMPLLFLVMGKFVKQAMKKADRDAVRIAVKNPERLPGLLNALAAAKFQFSMRDDVRAAVSRKEIAAGVEPVETATGLTLTVYLDDGRPESEAAGRLLQTALENFKEQAVKLKLRELRVSTEVLTPFTVKEEHVGPKQRIAGMVWGGMFGYIVVLLMFSGGMYPAIDLTAGEKERRTLEVLLSCPAGRNELILGKLLATTTAVFGTALLTVTSVFVSFKYMDFGKDTGKMREMLGNLPTDPATIALVLSVLLPTAVMGASLMIAIALFAKSFKEAQSYLTPLIMAVLFPLLIGLMPGMHLTSALGAVPIFNSCQLVKEIFQGEYSRLSYAVTMVANCTYAAIAFFAAVRVFKDERVLFRT